MLFVWLIESKIKKQQVEEISLLNKGHIKQKHIHMKIVQQKQPLWISPFFKLKNWVWNDNEESSLAADMNLIKNKL